MRKPLRFLLSMLSLIIALLSAAHSALAATTTLTFDEFADGTDITTQYQSQGVTVSGVSTINQIYTPWSSNSSPNLAAAPIGLMRFTLDSAITGPIQFVSAYVSGLTSVGIYAFDAAGAPVGQSVTPGATNNMLVTVTSSGNPIARIDIHDGGSNFAIDTLTFDTVPSAVPFSSFTPSLTIDTRTQPNKDSFAFGGQLTLGANGLAFNPATDIVTLKIGTVTTSIPVGAFQPKNNGFAFKGKIGNVNIGADIQPQGANQYLVGIAGKGASLTGVTNPVSVTLTIGNNTGTKLVDVKADPRIYNNPFGQ